MQRPLPDNTQHSHQTNIHAPGGIRTHNLSRRAAADLHHWDRRFSSSGPQILYYSNISSKNCCGDIFVIFNILNKAREIEWGRDVERREMLTGNARGMEELEDTEVDERSTLKWM